MPVAAPIISVIIPVYGRQGQLDSAIQSVLDQERLESGAVELIVVDDHSPEAVSVPSGFDIQLIRQRENTGAAGARNTGIEAASGRLIAFLDSDDIWLPNKLSHQVAQFDQLSKMYDPTLLAVGSGFYDPDRRTGKLRERVPRDGTDLKSFASGVWFCPGSSLVLDRRCFDLIGPQDRTLRRLEDLDWFIRFGKAGGKYFCTQQSDVIIRPSRNADFSSVIQSTTQLNEKYSAKGTSPLPADAWNRLAAYLALEKAVAHFSDQQLVSGVRELCFSLLRKPRLQPALEKFWTQSAQVPQEVDRLFGQMVEIDE